MRTILSTLCITLVLLCAATANAKIVFTKAQNGTSKIFVMDDDGGNIKQLNDTPYTESRPIWSPNGRRIAFLRDTTPDDDTINFYIFIMNANGSNVQQLSDGTINPMDLRYSPDGKELLYHTGQSGLRRLDIDSRQSNLIHPVWHVWHFDWSPDGQQIVFINDDHGIFERTLWMVGVNGDNPREWLALDPDRGTMNILLPRWSPDGEQILYTEMDTIVTHKQDEHGNEVATGFRAAGTFRIIVYTIDDGTTQALKIPNNWFPSALAWMDGQRSVLFSAYDFNELRNQPIVRKIYKYNLATHEMTFLTEGTSAHWNGNALPVSPLGKQSLRWGELKKAYHLEQD